MLLPIRVSAWLWLILRTRAHCSSEAWPCDSATSSQAPFPPSSASQWVFHRKVAGFTPLLVQHLLNLVVFLCCTTRVDTCACGGQWQSSVAIHLGFLKQSFLLEPEADSLAMSPRDLSVSVSGLHYYTQKVLGFVLFLGFNCLFGFCLIVCLLKIGFLCVILAVLGALWISLALNSQTHLSVYLPFNCWD